MSQYTDHDREQLEQWLDAYCDQNGSERVLTGKILDYIAATNERLRASPGACDCLASRALHEKTCASLRSTPEPSAEPVAYALQWKDDGKVNANTTFPTMRKAEQYRAMCSDPKGIEIVPLYRRAPEPGGDVVPRSRYDACNRDWLDEKAKREALATTSVAWIKILLAALRSAEARLNQPVYNQTESAGNQAANILRADIKSALAVIHTALAYKPTDSPETKEEKHD